MADISKCQEMLLNKAEKQGYLTFDDILNVSDTFSLSVAEVDILSEAIQLRGIIVYEETPRLGQDSQSNEALTDNSRTDYEAIFSEIRTISPQLNNLLEAIQSYPPPQYGEIEQLAKQIAEENQYARTRLIILYMRNVLKIALSMTKQYDLDLEDAISSGFIGLINAVDGYDSTGFTAFNSYAALWIQQSIQRYCNPLWIDYYFPAHYKEKMFPILQKYELYYRGEEIGTTMYYERISVIANEFEMTESDVDKMLRSVISQKYGKESFEEIAELELSADVSIPSDVVDGDEAMLSEVMQEELRETVDKMLNALSEREADVIRMRNGIGYGSTMTLEEIGNKMNITRERVRQIEAKAIRKLSQASRKKILRDFL